MVCLQHKEPPPGVRGRLLYEICRTYDTEFGYKNTKKGNRQYNPPIAKNELECVGSEFCEEVDEVTLGGGSLIRHSSDWLLC